MPRLLAIDLGSHAVKVSEFRTSGRRFELIDRHSLAVPQDGEIPTLTDRMKVLASLLDEHPEWGTSTVGATWPVELATSHRLTLPFADASKIEKTLVFAVEGEVPFDMDDMVLGWGLKSKGQPAEVLCLLARRDQVVDGLEQFTELGLDPRVLFVDGDVLSYYGAPNKTVAVVDIGHSHTVVSLVHNNIVRLFRSIDVAGHAFTSTIQRSLNCSWRQAESIKHGVLDASRLDDDEATDPGQRRGSGYGKLPPTARQQMDGSVGLLLAEVRATLIEAEDTLGLEVDEIKLTGGGSRISELWDYFSQDLGVGVARAMDHAGDPVPNEFAVSQALGMQMVGRNVSPAIDLRVGDLAYKGGTDVIRAILTYGGSSLAFFAVAALVMFVVQFRSLSVELWGNEDRIKSVVMETFPEVSSVSDTTTGLAIMREQTLAASERAKILGDPDNVRPPTVDTLFELTNAFPPHPQVIVNVTELKINDSVITLEAETDGYTSSSAVEEALQKSELFKTALKGDETKKGKSIVVFPITIPLDEEGAELVEEG
ncbi:MAG: pilus assembly protein PilM [Proteobacteria bacterium]|jgi:general secretion pathway protein L|nr:pilus assembly protein PilM [Pseudomonadota bacterium]